MPFRGSGYPGRAASCRKLLHSFSSFLESVCFWPFSFQSWSRLSHQIPARFGHAPRGSLRIALSKPLFSFSTFWNVISHIRLPSDPPRSKMKRIARTARPKSLSHPPPPSCHKNPRICRNLLAQFSNFLECRFSFCPHGSTVLGCVYRPRPLFQGTAQLAFTHPPQRVVLSKSPF